MAITKVSRNLLNTGISDSSDATAITIDSSEDITIGGKLNISTGTNGTPTINLSHTNANADNFRITCGVTGVANSGLSIYDVDATANRFVINADGDIGIGVNSPDSKLQIANEDGSTYRFGYGGTSDIYFDSDSVRFRTDNGGSGTATIDTDGLKFNNDTAAANALDDYEEGTWTPTFAGVAAAAVYGARYTKIGQLVMVEAYVAGDTQNNTNQFQIGGLPYTSHNVTAYGGGSIQYTSSQDYNNFSGPLIPGNSSYIYFHYLDGSQSGASVTNNVLYNKINGNQLFIFQAFYRTA